MKPRPLPWIALAVTAPALLLVACSDENTARITIWDGAFIMDSTTLGVIGWEYVHDMPDHAWDESEYSDINQYLYKYHLDEDRLELVAVLQEDASFYQTNPSVVYTAPWVVYMSYDMGDMICVYDFETGTNRVVARKPARLKSLSADGQYLVCLSYGIYGQGEVLDMATQAVVYGSEEILPFYVGPDSTIYAYAATDMPEPQDYAIGPALADGSGLADTVGYWSSKVNFVSSGCRYYGTRLTNGALGLGHIGHLAEGRLVLDTIIGGLGARDIDTSSGLYVFERGRGIWVGNYKAAVLKHELLPPSETGEGRN